MISSLTVTIIGSVAAACTTIAFLPQLVRMCRLRRAEEISTATFAFFSIGTILWLVYGLYLGSWPIILANGVTLCLAAAILGLKLAWGDEPRPRPT